MKLSQIAVNKEFKNHTDNVTRSVIGIYPEGKIKSKNSEVVYVKSDATYGITTLGEIAEWATGEVKRAS